MSLNKNSSWYYDVYSAYQSFDTKGDIFYGPGLIGRVKYVSEYEFIDRHDAYDYCVKLNQDEFEDNFRCARVDNKEELQLYITRIENGCCGQADYLCKVNGEWCYVGFNYGH